MAASAALGVAPKPELVSSASAVDNPSGDPAPRGSGAVAVAPANLQTPAGAADDTGPGTVPKPGTQ